MSALASDFRAARRSAAARVTLCYAISLVVVACGTWLGWRHPAHAQQAHLEAALVRFDAVHYRDIAENGYHYATELRSTVAFFPAYPLIARTVAWTLGVSSVVALLVVANGCLLGATFFFARYLAVRGQRGEVDSDIGRQSPSPPTPLPEGEGSRSAAYALWVFALLPTTFFFRMPYSEAMFVLVAIAVLYAIERKWPLGWIAALVGLATAVRPVGVALVLPLVWFALKRPTTASALTPGPSPEERGEWLLGPSPGTNRRLVQRGEASLCRSRKARRRKLLLTGRLACVLPLGCWGLFAYMAFQYAQFGDPLAFAKTQTHWRARSDAGFADKALSLASWEPIWSAYVPDTPAYFGGFEDGEWIRNMRFFNPIFFAGTVVIVAIGVYKHWLTVYEILLSIGLLAIPYLTRAYEMCMASQGRFAAVVVPAYIVMGHLLARLPRWLAVAILAASAFGLAFFTSRFAGGYAYF